MWIFRKDAYNLPHPPSITCDWCHPLPRFLVAPSFQSASPLDSTFADACFAFPLFDRSHRCIDGGGNQLGRGKGRVSESCDRMWYFWMISSKRGAIQSGPPEKVKVSVISDKKMGGETRCTSLGESGQSPFPEFIALERRREGREYFFLFASDLSSYFVLMIGVQTTITITCFLPVLSLMRFLYCHCLISSTSHLLCVISRSIRHSFLVTSRWAMSLYRIYLITLVSFLSHTSHCSRLIDLILLSFLLPLTPEARSLQSSHLPQFVA